MRLLMVAAALLVASCGESANQQPPTSTAPSSSPVTGTAITELANRVFPPTSAQSHPPGTDGYVECEFFTGIDFDFSNCPVTDRFLARLRQNPNASDRARPFCRCQNILPIRIVTAEPSTSGGVAHINLGNATIDLIMKVERGRLLVDDTQCAGKGPETSYYNEPVHC